MLEQASLLKLSAICSPQQKSLFVSVNRRSFPKPIVFRNIQSISNVLAEHCRRIRFVLAPRKLSVIDFANSYLAEAARSFTVLGVGFRLVWSHDVLSILVGTASRKCTSGSKAALILCVTTWQFLSPFRPRYSKVTNYSSNALAE
jgi:hypothetical protein